MAKAKLVKARLLADVVIDGRPFACNRVIEGTEKQIAGLVTAGNADTDPEAVDYALSLNSEWLPLDAPLDAETDPVDENPAQ